MSTLLFILSNTNLGGAEKQAIQLACGLRDMFGYEVRFICHGEKEGTATMLLDKSLIPFIFFPIYNENDKVQTFQGLFRLMQEIRKCRSSILMPYVSLANYYCSLIWRLTNANLCIWNQRDEGLGLPAGFISKLVINNASHYISNSSVGKTILNEKFGVSLKKISVIYNGISIIEPGLSKAEWRTKYGFSSEDILVCMIANITKHKNHITLINAWELILKNNIGGKNAKLLLAGRKDDKFDDVNQLVSRLPNPSSVFYLDYVDDVVSLLNAIDISVLTSKSEGLSNSVLESMSGGLVVLGTNINGISEPLSNENKQYLSDPDNETQLYHSLCEMIVNPDLRNKLGELNKLKVKNDFQMTHAVKETHQLINKLKPCTEK